MPIRPDLQHFYGKEWRTVTRPRILERAGNCCEDCGKPNGAYVETLRGDQRMFWRLAGFSPGDAWIDNNGTPVRSSCNARQVEEIFKTPWFGLYKLKRHAVTVVLTVAHLNHHPGDDRDDNLKALCQWCHLNHDKQHHRETRQTRKDRGRPLLTLAEQAHPE